MLGSAIFGGGSFAVMLGTVAVMAWKDRQSRLRYERRQRDRYIHI